MKKKLIHNALGAWLTLFSSISFSEMYYLCGSDEDGCYDYQSCACIPQNETHPAERFCFDFDQLMCIPLSQKPDCYKLFIHASQGECLATLFQSEPNPPCPLVPRDFCLANHVVFCDSSGQFSSCK